MRLILSSSQLLLLSTMQITILLSSLVLAVSAIPQVKSNVEAKFVTMLFTKYCGSSTSQPTCSCSDNSSFLHPFYIRECDDGSAPLSCVCPDGSFFAATMEQILGSRSLSSRSSCVQPGQVCNFIQDDCCSGSTCVAIWEEQRTECQ